MDIGRNIKYRCDNNYLSIAEYIANESKEIILACNKDGSFKLIGSDDDISEIENRINELIKEIKSKRAIIDFKFLDNKVICRINDHVKLNNKSNPTTYCKFLPENKQVFIYYTDKSNKAKVEESFSEFIKETK